MLGSKHQDSEQAVYKFLYLQEQYFGVFIQKGLYDHRRLMINPDLYRDIKKGDFPNLNNYFFRLTTHKRRSGLVVMAMTETEEIKEFHEGHGLYREQAR